MTRPCERALLGISNQIGKIDFHLSAEPDKETLRQLRRHEATGRPAGSERFIKRLEKLLGRVLHLRQAGRKKKAGNK